MSQQQTIVSDDIPSSFTQSVERPFEPIGKRNLYEREMIGERSNERLTDEQVQQIVENPQITESTRLQRLTEQANKARELEMEEEKIYNMSIKDLAFRTSDTVHNVIDDMLLYDPEDGLRGFIHIFTKSDRLIYVGIIILAFTILLAIIKSTD